MDSMQDREAQYIINTYGRKKDRTPCLVEGRGSYVWDDRGKRYLDFLSGLAVNVLGHCHPEVVKAVNEQVSTLIHTSNLYFTAPQVQLAEQLVEKTLPGGKVFFANSGAEANEAAIKLARKSGAGRYKIVTAKQSFHGRTLAALTATGQPKYQKAFQPLVEGFAYAVFNEADSFANLVDEQTAAVMVEPIQGESGVYPAERAFLEELREICDRYKALLIFDEVQCGMGRTGSLWAFENWGVSPDLLTAAKGLGGGLPVGVLVAAAPYADILVPGDHASTFGGNPVICKAALAVLRVLEQDGFLKDVREKGKTVKMELEKMASAHPGLVREFRGLGLICALELKKPLAGRILEKCTSEGLLINAIGDYTLRFLPPLTIANSELEEGLSIIKRFLEEEDREEDN